MIVPGEPYGAIECARSKIDRDSPNHADGIKTSQRSEVRRKKQYDHRQTDGNGERPGRNTVAIELFELTWHLPVARHHVKQTDHRHDGGVGRAQEQEKENNSNNPSENLPDSG